MVTTKQKTIVDTQKNKEKRVKAYYSRKPSNYQVKARKEEKNREELKNNQITLSTYLSTMTLNMNGLNSPIKRHRVADRLKISHICMLPTRDSLQIKDTHRLKMKDRNIYSLQMEM